MILIDFVFSVLTVSKMVKSIHVQSLPNYFYFVWIKYFLENTYVKDFSMAKNGA